MPRLICPRISPEWELAAQLALVKPKPYTKDKIAHRDPRQPWPRGGRRIVENCLNGDARLEFPATGQHRIIVELDAEPSRARRIARKISRCLPELWFVLDGETYFRGGIVYRRTGRYNLELVRADRTRLRRAVRFGFLGDVDYAKPRHRHRARHDAPAQRDS